MRPGGDGGAAVRNPGIPFDSRWVRAARPSGRPDEIGTRGRADRTPGSPEGEAVALLTALRCVDLTSLSPSDTPAEIRRLCARALRPLSTRLSRRLAAAGQEAVPAAVCVYPAFIDEALGALEGASIPVATVAGGFPHGLVPLARKVEEIRGAVASGAREIDAVLARFHLLAGDWKAAYDEVRACRDACGPARLKVILEAGELDSPGRIARTARVCLAAGAEFLKTSTGKGIRNAGLSEGRILAREIRLYRDRTGHEAGLKAAGGLRTAREALGWLRLVEAELGPGSARPALFRLGASSLLDDLSERIEALLRRDGMDPEAVVHLLAGEDGGGATG